MSPVCGFELSPRPSLPAGFELSPRPSLPAGRDFGPVRTCGAFPPTAARRAPPVHEATGGYAVRSPCPSGIPRPRHNASPLGLEGLPCFDLLAASIRKSGLEIENRCTDCPCFDLFAASIRKSGLEIRNRCTDCLGFDLMAASIRKSGPEIKNHCSAIVPASRIARLRRRCRNGAASDSNFLRCKVLQFRLRKAVAAKLNGSACCVIVILGKNGPPAALSWSQGRVARLQNDRCGCRREQDATKAA